MTKTLNIPASTSTLTNTLLFVITDPVMRWEAAARAAELIALDLRIHEWWIEVGVVNGSQQEAEELLKETGPAGRRIETAWADYLRAPERDGKRPRECIEEACAIFLDALTIVVNRTAEIPAETPEEAPGSWLRPYRTWEQVTHTSPESKAVKARLEALLAGVRGTFSDEEIDVVREFIDDGHYLVALSNFAAMVNRGKLVFGKTRAEVMRLGALLKSDSPFVLGIMDVEEAPLPGDSVFTLAVPASSSALVNTLLFVVADAEMLWDTAARAADLISLDLRIDQWCAQVGGVSGSKHEMEEVIRRTGQAAARVKSAWAAYLVAPDLDIKEVKESIEEARQIFGAVLAEVGRGPTE